MKLSPFFYSKCIRPKFAIKKYIQKIIKEECDLKGKILDFGCGTGDNAFIFNPKRYLGVDIDSKRLTFARKKFPGYVFKEITNNKIPSKNKSFDIICVFATLHHIPNASCEKYVKEFKRVLKPKGRLLIIEPCLTEKNKVSNWFMQIFDEGNYIREGDDYKKLFERDFNMKVHKKFKKYFLYNEIFFSGTIRSK